jgi:hypothetical protein
VPVAPHDETLQQLKRITAWHRMALHHRIANTFANTSSQHAKSGMLLSN